VEERKRVLLIEDHALLRGVLALRLVQELDLEVCEQCSSLAEARAALSFQQFDAAVVDIFLPDGNAMDLIRELRDFVPRSIPTLALIESYDPQGRAQALNAGASKVLTKGVGFGDIVAELRCIMEEGRAHSAPYVSPLARSTGASSNSP
jgi:DNA-binding NarL/FixJ family response regulator